MRVEKACEEREREVKSISMAERETSGPTTALDCVQLQTTGFRSNIEKQQDDNKQ